MLTDPDTQSLLCSPGKPFGNRFSLITLVRKRARNLVDGSPPLIQTESRNAVSIALQEMHQGKIRIRLPGSPPAVEAEESDPLTLQAEALARALGV